MAGEEGLKPDEMFPTVHPRVYAMAQLQRANAAMSKGQEKRERLALTLACAWWMRCANEGWERIQRELALSGAMMAMLKTRERKRYPMEWHKPEAFIRYLV
jgi:hypothetical protein